MKVVFDSEFLKKLKKVDIKIKKSIRERIAIFSRDPNDLLLDNHSLDKEFEGHKSIDITSNYRAIYIETQIGDEMVAYFETFGTHKELYGRGA